MEMFLQNRRMCRLAAVASAILPLAVSQFALVVDANAAAQREQRTLCSDKPHPQGNERWVYRSLEGRKCWYKGPQVIAKSNLYWPPGPEAKAQDTNLEDARAEYVPDSTRPEADHTNAPVTSRAPQAGGADTFDARWRGEDQ